MLPRLDWSIGSKRCSITTPSLPMGKMVRDGPCAKLPPEATKTSCDCCWKMAQIRIWRPARVAPRSITHCTMDKLGWRICCANTVGEPAVDPAPDSVNGATRRDRLQRDKSDPG